MTHDTYSQRVAVPCWAEFLFHHEGQNKKMRRAIVVSADYRFMSALVDKRTASELKIGDRVRAARALDVGHFGRVPAGETATIVGLDVESGYVDIQFDRQLDELYEWRNCLLLVPFDTADWIEGLELVSCLEAKQMPIIKELLTTAP